MRTIVRLLALAALAFPRVGMAAPTPDPTADVLFDEARRLFKAGKTSEACAAFETSYKISSSLGTLSNLARCRELNHQLATAFELYRDLERATAAGTDERQKRMHSTATERLAQLNPQLSRLTIRVSARPDGLRILRNQTELAVAVWNTTTPVDGGTYTFVASAPGYEAWSSTISIGAANDTKLVDVALTPLRQAPAPAPSRVVAPAQVQPTQPVRIVAPTIAPEQPASSRSKKVGMRLLSATAGALLISAVAVELSARRTNEAAGLEADDTLQATMLERAKSKHVMAMGMGAAGVGAAGVALYLFLRKDPSPGVKIGKSNLQPSVSTQHVGLQLTRNY